MSLFACEKPEKLVTKEGFLQVNGGRVWYRVTGGGDGVPIILLHGGPGYPSHYLNPLTALSAGRPVIMFDQLGCGRSDRTGDTTLMSMDNHIHQVKQLVKELDLHEFFLYGHSWGTMLATDYYLNYPRGVKALILASPCLSAKMWVPLHVG
jgi:proline iminopeptidase